MEIKKKNMRRFLKYVLILICLFSFTNNSSAGGNVCGVHETPNAVFDYSQKLLRDKDINQYYHCINKEDRYKTVESTLVALLMASSFFDDINNALLPILKKHGYTTGGDVEVELKRIKNIKQLYVDLFSVLSLIYEKNGQVPGDINNKLSDIVIKGKFASGTIIYSGNNAKTEKAYFKQNNGGWYLSLAE